MTDRDPNPSRTLLSMQDLRWRALAEIRKQPGCSNVQGIAINRVTDERAENNWSLCVLSAGTADANTAARAALYVQQERGNDNHDSLALLSRWPSQILPGRRLTRTARIASMAIH